MPTSSRISELSTRIAANTAKIDRHLSSLSLPRPSFHVDAPQDLFLGPNTNSDIEAARQAVLQDSVELRQLLLTPRELLLSHRANYPVSQLVTTRFGLAQHVPIEGDITFADLAAAVGLGETHVRKVIRHGMTQRLFCEPRPGHVAHTASSRLLVDDPDMAAWVRWCSDECWRAAVYTCDAMAKWPGSGEPNETGFSMAHGTQLGVFDFLSENDDRAARFAAGMRLYARRPDLDVRFLVEGGPWAQLPPDAKVVDVGGSHGEAAIAIARAFPSMKFVVQDIDAEIVARAPPGDVRRRVEFAQHDFFTEQPVRDADAYLFRACFHNWSDKYAVRMLQALIPALRPGARVVVNDVVVSGSADTVSAGVRSADLDMLMLFNSGDREMEEWERLFMLASPGFRFKGGHKPEGSALWVLTATWEGVNQS